MGSALLYFFQFLLGKMILIFLQLFGVKNFIYEWPHGYNDKSRFLAATKWTLWLQRTTKSSEQNTFLESVKIMFC